MAAKGGRGGPVSVWLPKKTTLLRILEGNPENAHIYKFILMPMHLKNHKFSAISHNPNCRFADAAKKVVRSSVGQTIVPFYFFQLSANPI